ncbi:TPA: quinone-dependent dihydroorotate dehydrogenase, partial [Acinetobacter baumannii]
MLYSLARPMLFSLAPERAHELTLSMLDKAHKLGMMRQTVEAKPTTCMGIEFPNP